MMRISNRNDGLRVKWKFLLREFNLRLEVMESKCGMKRQIEISRKNVNEQNFESKRRIEKKFLVKKNPTIELYVTAHLSVCVCVYLRRNK